MAQQLVTFEDIHDFVVEISGLGQSSAASNRINRMINLSYQSDSMLRRWRWLESTSSTVVPTEYTTGTASIVDGLTAVVGSDVAWTSAMDGSKFFIQDQGDVYTISSVTDATNLTLSASYAGTSASTSAYSIYQDTYTCPSDCEELIDIYHWKDKSRTRKQIDRRAMLDTQLLRKGWTGEVKYWTHGDWASGDSRTFQIWPARPSADYRLFQKYSMKVTDLDAGADEPLTPISYRSVHAYGALEQLFMQQGNQQRAAWARGMHQEMLNKMMKDDEASDRRLKLSARWSRGKRHSLSPARYDLGSAWEDGSFEDED